MDNGSREMEILKKKSKGNARNQEHCNRNKKSLDAFINRLETKTGKESVSLKKCQQTVPKVKRKEKRE